MPQDPISQLAIQSPFSLKQETRKALFKSSSYIYIGKIIFPKSIQVHNWPVDPSGLSSPTKSHILLENYMFFY